MARRDREPQWMAEPDTNSTLSGLLRDLSLIQPSIHRKWAYTRAAAAVMSLDEPLEALLGPGGQLRKIPDVGPSSLRIAMEVLRTGESATVEHALAASPKAAEVARSRQLRQHFLSRARVIRAIKDRTLDGPRLEDYLGDLQVHSTWSDGADSLADLVKGSLAREYRFLAVTDHSHGLPIARGVSTADLPRQHREIDALNRKHGARFRLLKGIEANILADGRLDLSAEELRQLDIVVAAPHAKLRAPEDQTDRMLAAVRTPGVHILGHPRGRKFGARAGVIADWPRVFADAARRRVAIEIDGDPSRQDLDYVLAAEALRAGCLFALDSDAHAVAEFAYAETAIAHARLAGIPRSRIINCWEVDRLLEWADERRRARVRSN